jgi:DNA-binding transcriptional LysR family regulator
VGASPCARARLPLCLARHVFVPGAGILFEIRLSRVRPSRLSARPAANFLPKAADPDVQLELVEGFSGDVIEKLLSGVIDVAIIDIPSTPFAELNVTPFWVETFSLFGWMDAPAVQPDRTMPVTLAGIAELPMIAPGKRHAVRHLLEEAFERRSLKFRPVLEHLASRIGDVGFGREVGKARRPRSRSGVSGADYRAR